MKLRLARESHILGIGRTWSRDRVHTGPHGGPAKVHLCSLGHCAPRAANGLLHVQQRLVLERLAADFSMPRRAYVWPALAVWAIAAVGVTPAASSASCQPGYALSCNGTDTCVPCAPGYWCAGGISLPIACSTGTYNPHYGSSFRSNCTVCASGYYQTSEASGQCDKCPAGYSCSDPGDEPERCSPGSYSLGNATGCSACPAG